MTISFVWFDLGYTLVYQEREKAFERFLLEEGIDLGIERIELAYHLADKLFMREYPGVLGREPSTFYPWYIGVLNHFLGLHFDLERQCRRLRELQRPPERAWRPFPEAARVLRELHGMAVGTGLISNWDASARTVLEDAGLLSLLDPVVVSSEVGAAKPDPEIFRIALERAGVPAERCLYVGDNYYDDVVGSAGAGMRSCLINRFGSRGVEEIGAATVLTSVGDVPAYLRSAVDTAYSYLEKRRQIR
ncbi:HAD family hydrolase [Cohnella massiliensis]|uniref:HAD family hydrolase n=1 Tax=Cohnella massiliensis TaxID=1816691 RepID=UPI0009B9B87D|nr:HAD-IA family hydrolase [Cohnella massiliensis]